MKPTPYSPPKHDLILDGIEAAKILNITAPTLRALSESGVIGRIGRKYRKSAILRLKKLPQVSEEI